MSLLTSPTESNDEMESISGYRYHHAKTNKTHGYLLPTVEQALGGGDKNVFDLGCGNGSVAAHLASLGYDVSGVDPSTDGIDQANKTHPHLSLRRGSAYDDLASQYGRFAAVVSLEVVEHVYDPRKYAATLYDLVQEGGCAVVSTPCHGYWKNLALAVTGKMDNHFTVLWDHGHIKFWSIETLSALLSEAGFVDIEFHRVGRLPTFAKSMIAVARKRERRLAAA